MNIRHCGTKEIVTERLRLRPFRAEDAADVFAGCDAANTGSARVLEKIGMKREGCFRQAILRKDGSWGDDLQYGLFREELT